MAIETSRGHSVVPRPASARITTLIAALLGWMFDGFEMGLFPVISRPALAELVKQNGSISIAELDVLVGRWNSLAIASFLIGAAAGGVLFGWLGDRIGRVRAMSLSILTYALVSGLGAFAINPWQIVAVRFIAALGMGGEWSLGVALVMEVWQGQSKAILAGLIGAAANAGYALVATLTLTLGSIKRFLLDMGVSNSWAEWRLLMLCGIIPALLTLFIRMLVRESEDWTQEHSKGSTKAWATQDLWGVLVGLLACFGIIVMWGGGMRVSLPGKFVGTLFALLVVAMGYLYPVHQYLKRSGAQPKEHAWLIRRMLMAALISGIPLLGTWASVQWAPTWADQLANQLASAKAVTQLCSASGSIVGGIVGALAAVWIGRRAAYAALSLLSLGSVWLFYWTNQTYNSWFLFTAFLMGAATATFYGWLPLYLPEIFPTRVRATGQGFGFNFGRILAAIGALQTGAIIGAFKGDYSKACGIMGAIYVLGPIVISFAPQVKEELSHSD